MVIRTSAGEIRYVYKGELLSAEEFIKAQDDMIQELKKRNQELFVDNRKLQKKITLLESDLKRNQITECQKDTENL